MVSNQILGITIPNESKHIILEKIKKYLSNPSTFFHFFHIVSLNPENLVIAYENNYFKKVISTAQIQIIDGVGVIIAGQILGMTVGERFGGVDLMLELIKTASNRRLRVLLIGGKPNLALNLSKCYSQTYPEAKFLGVEGIRNIEKPTQTEEKAIFSIVSNYRPHIVLAAFGSPAQELWIDRHKKEFEDCLVMGVGGAFDYLSGIVGRAPVFLRKIGLEWLYRLIRQPWRFKRQLRLVKFTWLVFIQRIQSL